MHYLAEEVRSGQEVKRAFAELMGAKPRKITGG